MKRIGLFIALLAFLSFAIPSMTTSAQDAKKEGDKKDEAKKDEAKKDDPKKDDDKKPEPKKPVEKFVFGYKFRTKIISMGATSREFTVERYELDPNKQKDYNNWYSQRTGQLATQLVQANQQKDFKARAQALANYNKDYAAFQIENTKRSNNLMSAKPFEVRATENAKVRSLYPPVEFDDAGFLKKWTKKELEERKDKSNGYYIIEFDQLKTNQWVEIYMAKAAPMPKTPTKKKADDDDPPAKKDDRADFVQIVIVQEAGK